MTEATEKTARVLSIDAWRNTEGGWDWNTWYHVGDVPASLLDAGPRRILRELRERGYLRASSAGKVAIEDDGYNLVIMAKGTRCPAYALEYGALN